MFPPLGNGIKKNKYIKKKKKKREEEIERWAEEEEEEEEEGRWSHCCPYHLLFEISFIHKNQTDISLSVIIITIITIKHHLGWNWDYEPGFPPPLSNK